MVKVEMKDFIAHMMMESAKGDLKISHIRQAVNYVLSKGLAERWDNFDDSLEGVLSVVLSYPQAYSMSFGTTLIRAKEFSALQISVQNPLPKDIIDALKEFINMPYDEELNLLYETENEERINSSYMDWLCAMLDSNDRLTTGLTFRCKTCEDIANLSLISVLHSIVSEYYSFNLITPYVYENKEGYAFTYNWNGKETGIVIRQIENKMYQVLSISKAEDMVSFENIINNVPVAMLTEKKALLKQINKLFQKAPYIDLSYKIIESCLYETYGEFEE